MQTIQRSVSLLAKKGEFSSACLNCNNDVGYSILSTWFTRYASGKPMFPEPKKWPTLNDKLYPPEVQKEEIRPAYVCHMKLNMHYSPKKLWYIAAFVRGMAVDEALKQLHFVPKKGAVYVTEAILEAQRLAVEEHNVEFKSNLWVAESFVGKALTLQGIRRHARKRFGRVDYRYSHYFVRLEEGPPPKQYYWSEDMSGEGLLKKWLDEKRDRRILKTL